MPGSELLELKIRRKAQVNKHRRLQKVAFFCFFVSVSLPLLIIATFVSGDQLPNPLYILLGITYSTVPVMALLYFGLTLRQVKEEIQDSDFEIDLLKYQVNQQESRAEKLLQISNTQLRRYYNLNLNQNIWVFCLGIVCILIGVSIIGITLLILLRVASDTETKIIAGAVGAIGSLLVNYVAAIYLKIHAEAASNLDSFHSRLEETNQMLIANLLASRIEDKIEREKTLSQLSINVGARKNN